MLTKEQKKELEKMSGEFKKIQEEQLKEKRINVAIPESLWNRIKKIKEDYNTRSLTGLVQHILWNWVYTQEENIRLIKKRGISKSNL